MINSVVLFTQMVSEDVKNNLDQSEKDILRLPENRERWRDSLLDIIETVNAKMDHLENEINELRSKYTDFVTDPAAGLEEQLKKTARFRFHAEKRLAEADRLLSMDSLPDPSLSLASFLKDAILAHKKWHEDKGLVNSEGDDYLYAALDGVWRF